MKFFSRLFGLKNSFASLANKRKDAMFTLCEGIIGDTARVLTDQGYNKPIITVELMVFSTFIISETYMLGMKASPSASGHLDEFHKKMANHFFNEHILQEHPEVSVENMFRFHEQLHSLMVKRYPEYRAALREDLKNQNTIFKKTVESLLQPIPASPVSAEESEQLLIPLAIKIAFFYTGCLSSFKEREN